MPDGPFSVSPSIVFSVADQSGSLEMTTISQNLFVYLKLDVRRKTAAMWDRMNKRLKQVAS